MRKPASIGISNHLFPDGQPYSHPEHKSIAGDRALFGEDSPLSMRIHPLKRPELPPFDANPLKRLELPPFGARCPPPPHEPKPCGMVGPVAEPFWPSGDQACSRGKPSPSWSRTSW